MSGVIGQALSRRDGRVKVTGSARYTADIRAEGALMAVLVSAPIASGTITGLDLEVAKASPGVAHIFTHLNTPKFGVLTNPPAGHTVLPLQGDRIFYEGQPVALVLADTLENATEAARRVGAEYRIEQSATEFRAMLDHGEALPFFGTQPDRSVGDIPAAMTAAEVKVEGVYETADRHHNPMEPSATLAIWQDGRLLIHDAVQGVVLARAAIAQALGIEPENVRVKNDFVGGGFGCKGWVWPHQVLAAMAARELRRPVKIVLTRAQSFTGHGYQPMTHQRVTLAAKSDGALTGIRHNAVTSGSFVGDHVEPAALGSLSLYAAPAIETTHRMVRLNKGNPTPMRAPLDGVGLVAVEIAMDELAYKLGLDPLALRLKNYAEVDPSDGKPFSSKKLRECYVEGAKRFGWAERTPQPGSMRDGNERIGWGMATAFMPTFRQKADVRLTIDRAGKVLIETSTQEIGTGVYTIFPQIAAEVLGLPAENVTLSLGDTSLPAGPMTAGSSATVSVGSAVLDAAGKLKQKLTEAGAGAPAAYAEALRKLGVESLSADGTWAPDKPTTALFTFGAIFAEVRVDRDLPIPRVRRVVGVYSAGRIINPRTATSQMTGGIIWGIGQALLESSEMDHRLGRFLSKNLAGYLLPVNADAPTIEAHFVDEFDATASPIGARGIGELGATGTGPAIANAVFHATGKRVRTLPIRPEHLLDL